VQLPSATHIVLIPSYNPGPKVYETVRPALRCWNPVWVIVDGSTDDISALTGRLGRVPNTLVKTALTRDVHGTLPQTGKEA
jgi:hypothetical protein